jgi:hypothetical protein
MRGTVYKRGMSWTVVYDEPSPDGKRRQRSKGGFATKREASAYLADTLARLGGGTYTSPSRLTLGEYQPANGCRRSSARPARTGPRHHARR